MGREHQNSTINLSQIIRSFEYFLSLVRSVLDMDFTVTSDSYVGEVEYDHSGTAKDNGSHLLQTFHLQFKQSPVLFFTDNASFCSVVLHTNKI